MTHISEKRKWRIREVEKLFRITQEQVVLASEPRWSDSRIHTLNSMPVVFKLFQDKNHLETW